MSSPFTQILAEEKILKLNCGVFRKSLTAMQCFPKDITETLAVAAHFPIEACPEI
jgi:hypothetical protein